MGQACSLPDLRVLESKGYFFICWRGGGLPCSVTLGPRERYLGMTGVCPCKGCLSLSHPCLRAYGTADTESRHRRKSRQPHARGRVGRKDDTQITKCFQLGVPQAWRVSVPPAAGRFSRLDLTATRAPGVMACCWDRRADHEDLPLPSDALIFVIRVS